LVASPTAGYTEKIGFGTAAKLGTTNKFFVAATIKFAAATKRFVDRTKHFVVKKCFCYPYDMNLVSITKPFFFVFSDIMRKVCHPMPWIRLSYILRESLKYSLFNPKVSFLFT